MNTGSKKWGVNTVPEKDILHGCVVNFRIVWGDKQANLRRIKGYIEAAAKSGAELIVFPEMCLQGYSDDKAAGDKASKMHNKEAETVPGASSLEIGEITKKYGVYAVWGMAERDTFNHEVIYNSAVVCGPEGVIGSYRKIHVAGDEWNWASAGDKPFMFETPWGKIGIGICYDNYHFPELSRFYASQGCRVLLNPTAVCALTPESWENGYKMFLKYIVATSGIFVLSSNITGKEVLSAESGGSADIEHTISPMRFAGGSVIIGPGVNKQEIHQTHVYAGGFDIDECGMFSAVIDLSLGERRIYQVNPMTGRSDYRPELYAKWWGK